MTRSNYEYFLNLTGTTIGRCSTLVVKYVEAGIYLSPYLNAKSNAHKAVESKKNIWK